MSTFTYCFMKTLNSNVATILFINCFSSTVYSSWETVNEKNREVVGKYAISDAALGVACRMGWGHEWGGSTSVAPPHNFYQSSFLGMTHVHAWCRTEWIDFVDSVSAVHICEHVKAAQCHKAFIKSEDTYLHMYILQWLWNDCFTQL